MNTGTCGKRCVKSMSYKVQYLPLAVQDLEHAASYLMSFYPGTASKVLVKLETQLSRLSDNPFLYEVYAENPEFRRIVASDYLVFYKVNEDAKTVDIYRILRGSWDVKRFLDGE